MTQNYHVIANNSNAQIKSNQPNNKKEGNLIKWFLDFS